MIHDIQWIHKGSSCILLRSSMSKVSCLQIHNDRKEILSSFVTKEKIICNRRPKKKPYSSDQVKRQIKYQCWHVDKHTRAWGSLFIFPWGVYEAAAFLIPVSCVSLVCMNYYIFIYDLAYCIQTQQTMLELKETESYGLRFLFQHKDNCFSNNLFIKLCTQRCMEYTDWTNLKYLPRIFL